METDLAKDRELGRELARVREAACLTQAELAGRLGVSQTVVSRTESGERQLKDDKIRDFVEAIGTDEARGLEARRSRDWSKLKRPPLGHPNHDLLWSAELKLRELKTLLSQPDITQAFARRIEALCSEIESAAAELLKRECNLVFIGKIGVGKTSAICQIAGLTVSGSESRRPSPVLDVGSGRTTLCEVEIRTGPTSIVVEPCTDAEVRAHVADFAEKILRAIKDSSERGPSQDDQIMSREVERAIRNMANLRRPSARRTEGPRTPDPARELARQIFDEEIKRGKGEQDAAWRLQFEILSRMRTDRRERQDLRWDQGAGVDHREWLKSEFHRINTGNNPDFTIPKRIRVFVDLPLLSLDGDVEIRIVDTKGIDETVARADLERHVGAAHTVLVLCSGFNDAPGTEATNLLSRACEAGIRRDELHGFVLGLPKFDEALQTLDDAGEAVGSIEDGYDLKTIVVEETVHQSLGYRNFSVRFFNSHEDNAAEVRQELSDRIGKVFDAYRNTVDELVESAGGLIANYKDEQAQEIVRQAAVLIRSWIKKNKDLGSVRWAAEQSLLSEVKSVHPASIHATMRRKGGWYNLDYPHHLAYGARLVVSSILRFRVQSFAEHCDTFLGADEHRPAEPLLSQAQRALEKASQTATERAQLLGETWFHESLEEDDEFWGKGVRRWGGGTGYVNDISTMNKSWFLKNGELNEKMKPMIEREWKRAMKVVESMLEDD
ncbi:MAG: helix-turn-helix transcriptional regulator [Albidovulum sp.]|nr:helix-turn-helix transcriptional regulator [Albidovulum sp.]